MRFVDSLAVAAPAAAATGGLGLLGSLAAAPTWLLSLGQAAVVVYFTVRGVEKRMSRLHTAVNETRGELETLRGRLNGLACLRGDPRPRSCPEP